LVADRRYLENQYATKHVEGVYVALSGPEFDSQQLHKKLKIPLFR